MTKDILYQAVYWDAIRIIANHFPDKQIDLEVNNKNESFVLEPPKKLLNKFRFYSFLVLYDSLGYKRKLPIYHDMQLYSLRIISAENVDKKIIDHQSILVEWVLSSTKSREQVKLLKRLHEKVYIMDELKKCEAIWDVLKNLEETIYSLVFLERMRVYKELIYLQHYYEPFYIKKLTTI